MKDDVTFYSAKTLYYAESFFVAIPTKKHALILSNVSVVLRFLSCQHSRSISLSTLNLSNCSWCFLLDDTPHICQIKKICLFQPLKSSFVISYYLFTWMQPSLTYFCDRLKGLIYRLEKVCEWMFLKNYKTCSGLQDYIFFCQSYNYVDTELR